MPLATVKLGDVVLASPHWRWVFLAGAKSPSMRFVVDNVVDKDLAATKNPITLTCKVTREDGSVESNLEAKKLYLGSRQRVGPWRTRWIVRDERSQFVNQLIGGRFNVTRRANDLDQLNVAGGDVHDIPHAAQLGYVSTQQHLHAGLHDSPQPARARPPRARRRPIVARSRAAAISRRTASMPCTAPV